MSPIRYRDEEPSLGSVLASLAVGALAGFAVGVVVAQKAGGLSGISRHIRRRFAELEGEGEEHEAYHRGHVDYGEDELEEEEEEYAAADAALEEQVLEAFEDDPVLSERAIDIGAVGTGVIELTGWVESEEESQRAEAVARRVPGVEAVVNRLSVAEEPETQPVERDEREEEALERDTSAPLPGGRWEGQRVGTGRRRQGSSDEPDRHADPKAELEDRWLDEEHAVREAAGDIQGAGERQRKGKKPIDGDRAGGGPIAPGGVPKADHVVNPDETQQT
jgi:hypothetical protein